MAGATVPSREPVELAAFLSDPESRSIVEQIDKAARDGRHIVQSGGVPEAIKYLRNVEAAPEVLIVDISGTDLPLSQMDRLAEVCDPSVRVIVVGDRQDVGLFRSLLRTGVADYILKPVHLALIAPHLNGKSDVAIGGGSARNGKLIVVSGACGGVGATTVAVNLAWHMAVQDHRRVALVDLDLYGQAMALQLDIKTDGGLLEAVASSAQLDPQFLENAMTQAHPRLAVLTGEVAWSDPIDFKVEQLEELIKVLEHFHHYVVIDLPRRPGPIYTYLLRRAHLRIMVTNRTLASIRDCGRMLELSDNIGGRVVVVLNDDRPDNARMLAVNDLERALRRQFDLKIAYCKNAAAQIDGSASNQPLAAVHRVFGRAIEALASNVVGRAKTDTGRWRRLLSKA